MLPFRNISYLSPMCCNFWEKSVNSHKTGQRCSTPLSCYFVFIFVISCSEYLCVSTTGAGLHRHVAQSSALIPFQRFSRAGPRGRGREWATLGVHPLSWLLSNNRLEKVPVVSVPHTPSNRLLLSNQDKGCTLSVAHSLPLPLGPALLNLSIMIRCGPCATFRQCVWFP